MQKIKNLLKNEKYRDIAKIIGVIFFYIIVFGIFKAGLDYQKVIQPKTYQKPEKVIEYTYEIVSNGVVSKVKYNNRKSLTQILDGHFGQNIELRIIRDGFKIESIYGSRNIKVSVNGKEVNPNIVSEESLNDMSTINVNF